MLKDLFRKIFKRKKLTVLLIVVIFIVGLVARRSFFPSKDGFEEGKVERGIVKEELILSGGVEAAEHARLSFLTSGELDYVGVKEGQKVKKGDVLARLDTTVLYQAYLSAEADLRHYDASRDKTYDELQGHEGDESYAQIEERTIAETYRDKAYNAYVAAEQNLANATLKAPFEGIVASINHPYTGINTSLTESQIEIVNPQTLYFKVSADQSEVVDLSQGQEVTIVLDSFSEDEYQGKVEYVGLTPMVGEAGTFYLVKVVFDEGSDLGNFRIGMTGDARFVTSQKENTLYVPVRFLKSDTGGRYLNVGKPNNKVYVETGLEGEDYVEIISDKVKEGDTIFN